MIDRARQTAKFRRLSRRLAEHYQCSRVMADTLAIGHLERLWHLTMRDAPRGDIGKLDDVEIADECGWESEPETFVAIMLEFGWIDQSDEHRLVVHDWHDHCPGLVKRNIERRGGFVTTQRSGLATPNDSAEWFGSDTKPNQTKPIDRSIARARGDGEPTSDRPTDRPTENFSGNGSAEPPATRPPATPPLPTPAFPAPIIAGPITADEWEAIEGPTIEAADVLAQGSDRKARHGDNWGLVARCLAFDLRHGTGLVRRVTEATRRGAAQKPFAYLKSAYLAQCESLGVDGHALLRTMEIPFKPTRQPRGDPAPVASAD